MVSHSGYFWSHNCRLHGEPVENHSLMEKDHSLLRNNEAASQTVEILEKINLIFAVILEAPLFSGNYAAQYALQLAQLSKELRELNQALSVKGQNPAQNLAQTDHQSHEEDILKDIAFLQISRLRLDKNTQEEDLSLEWMKYLQESTFRLRKPTHSDFSSDDSMAFL